MRMQKWSAICKSAPAPAIQMLVKISWQLNELELVEKFRSVWCVLRCICHLSCRIFRMRSQNQNQNWIYGHRRMLANHKRIFESQFYCDWSCCPSIIWTHNNFQRYLQIYINREFWQSSSITVRASSIFKIKSRHHNNHRAALSFLFCVKRKSLQ